MLLTDSLAPQLVATGFIGVGACIIFSILRSERNNNSCFAFVGVFLYILFQVYTPGPSENSAHGGWGDIEKTHELTAVLLLAIVWICSRLSICSKFARGPWISGLVAAILCLSIITLPLAALSGLYMFGYFVWYMGRRDSSQITWPLAGGVSAVVGMGAVAFINYKLTGMPSDQTLLAFWPYTDMKPLQEWGVMLELLWTHWYYTNYQLQSLPWDLNLIPLLWKYLRLEIWWPIAAAAIPAMVIRKIIPFAVHLISCERRNTTWWALVWFSMVVIISALFGGGRSQYISFYRLSSFSYGPSLCLVMLLWSYSFDGKYSLSKDWVRSASISIGIFLPLIIIFSTIPYNTKKNIVDNSSSIMIDSLRFAVGQYSLKDAFQHQKGRPGRTPWGGIYNGILPAWRIAGPNTRIWTFHPGSTCMLPGCNLQGFPAMRLTKQWGTVFFGQPDDAIEVLKSEGLNYFFFSKELGVADILPASRLFSQENIANHLAIRWSDGTSYLLSWPSRETRPIDHQFLSDYKIALDTSGLYNPFHDRMEIWEGIASYLSQNRSSLKPFNLPWCKNCEGMVPIDYQSLLMLKP
jgi:hypothetical protein